MKQRRERDPFLIKNLSQRYWKKLNEKRSSVKCGHITCSKYVLERLLHHYSNGLVTTLELSWCLSCY